MPVFILLAFTACSMVNLTFLHISRMSVTLCQMPSPHDPLTLKIDVIRPLETSVNIYHSTLRIFQNTGMFRSVFFSPLHPDVLWNTLPGSRSVELVT